MEILLKFWTGFGQNSAMPRAIKQDHQQKVWKLQQAPNQSVWYKLTFTKDMFFCSQQNFIKKEDEWKNKAS